MLPPAVVCSILLVLAILHLYLFHPVLSLLSARRVPSARRCIVLDVVKRYKKSIRQSRVQLRAGVRHARHARAAELDEANCVTNAVARALSAVIPRVGRGKAAVDSKIGRAHV